MGQGRRSRGEDPVQVDTEGGLRQPADGSHQSQRDKEGPSLEPSELWLWTSGLWN